MLGLGTLARKVFGTPNDRKVKSVRPLVAKINALEPEFAALSDEGRQRLDKIAKALADRPALQLTVIGHGDLEAERSGYQQTGRYDEVVALCDAFAARYPDAVRCVDFGTTPEGRTMKALVASRSGALTQMFSAGLIRR